MKELGCCTRVFFIIIGLIISASGIINSIACFTLNPQYFNLILLIDISFILYGIILAISVIRNKCLRVTATVFSIIAFIGGIIGSIAQYVLLVKDNNKINNEGIMHLCFGILFFRFLLYPIIMNVLFYFYWGIKILKNTDD